MASSGKHSITGALLAHIGSWRLPGPGRLATIVHDRAVVRRLLNSDNLPDLLRSRLVYDSSGYKDSSDAENDCAVDKDDPEAENVCCGLGYLDMEEDAYAVLAVDFEH